MYKNGLEDALMCCHKDMTRQQKYIDYGKGLFVGIVSALMYSGLEWEAAIKLMAENMRPGFNPKCLPDDEMYQKTWSKYYLA